MSLKGMDNEEGMNRDADLTWYSSPHAKFEASDDEIILLPKLEPCMPWVAIASLQSVQKVSTYPSKFGSVHHTSFLLYPVNKRLQTLISNLTNPVSFPKSGIHSLVLGPTLTPLQCMLPSYNLRALPFGKSLMRPVSTKLLHLPFRVCTPTPTLYF